MKNKFFLFILVFFLSKVKEPKLLKLKKVPKAKRTKRLCWTFRF